MIRKLKNFILEDEDLNPVVFSFGRMNPPHAGHGQLVDTVKDEAAKRKAQHEIVLSGSQDSEKNPLSSEKKLTHARRMFPDTNISAATPQAPTLIHHLARLNQAGHNHLVMVAGGDRIPEYQSLIQKYNGKPDKAGNVPFNFKKIEFVSAGERDPDSEGTAGLSASKVRGFVKNKDFYGFRQSLPSHVSDEHARELYSDVEAGQQAQPKAKKKKIAEDISSVMTSGGGEIRGLGMVSGDPIPGATFVRTWAAMNYADADTQDQIMNKVKRDIHDDLHAPSVAEILKAQEGNKPQIEINRKKIANIIRGKR